MIATISRFAAMAVLFLGAPAPAFSTDDAGLVTKFPDSSSTNILDGKRFVGQIGTVGESGGTEDLLVFQDGMFVSKECQRRCDYPPAPYWVRFVEDGMQVRVTSTCDEADATMVWTGLVKGDEIEGTITWTSERWYWTIEREMWFKGTLVSSEQASRYESQ